MGIFSDFSALAQLPKLKAGKKANLSISQIVGMITNMSDANRNLPKRQYDEVYALFKRYRKCKTKLNITIDDYLEIAIKIIKSFDIIAPYEKYSGNNELECSFMMQDIRNEIAQKNIQEELHNRVDAFGEANDIYINYLVENGKGLTREEAKAFVGILITNDRYGKDEALRLFRLYVDYLMSSKSQGSPNDVHLIWKISFFCGLLFSNQVLTKAESDALSNHYSQLLIAKVYNSQKG